MFGEVDCGNGILENNGHILCSLSKRVCNYKNGEQNGMKCSGYKRSAYLKYNTDMKQENRCNEDMNKAGIHDLRSFNYGLKEQFENRTLQDMYTEAKQMSDKQ